jgi:hypothetical protein
LRQHIAPASTPQLPVRFIWFRSALSSVGIFCLLVSDAVQSAFASYFTHRLMLVRRSKIAAIHSTFTQSASSAASAVDDPGMQPARSGVAKRTPRSSSAPRPGGVRALQRLLQGGAPAGAAGALVAPLGREAAVQFAADVADAARGGNSRTARDTACSFCAADFARADGADEATVLANDEEMLRNGDEGTTSTCVDAVLEERLRRAAREMRGASAEERVRWYGIRAAVEGVRLVRAGRADDINSGLWAWVREDRPVARELRAEKSEGDDESATEVQLRELE